ncbi:nucleotidyltransferase family protein [Chromobacterium subtsugae]|uniref:Nucleotidyltransferase family protein n=1 Tax=Chromobacterium subtsugae TaxID=251747 RepID=A0ABS7F8S0_9NEIS|nr:MULTISPECIES: nucleotidyltransferase family protein [Chromobacterium]MBW7564982.1 nucleotidyltransferase family protein [Chromobacterium subtsugae]MBW8286491.1 nucleotidyltransferase family protein [Chromobacterium subtsugae]WSE91466.1 nucleotidyltransferase family protein [Chromobacterium subtsugae]WVH59841.1 nucleotidyltransferase family protein [Chromobacterium subtsugae]
MLEERLRGLVRASPWLMEALRAARALHLADWCIGAGALRSLVWDALHGFASQPSALSDIDLAHFDASDLSPGRDAALQARLQASHPGLPWEVTNQAAVHLWFADYFGYAVEPLSSLEDGVATWPEYATAVGVALNADDSLRLIAPYGLDDLFAMRVRRNPARASVEIYRQRLAQKRYAERWPRVRVVESA